MRWIRHLPKVYRFSSADHRLVLQYLRKTVDDLQDCSLCKKSNFQFTYARAAFLYDGAIRTAIKKLKYAHQLGLSELFANFLISVYLRERWEVDLVTAVPLYKKRFASRGFNQSEWIAKPFAKAIGKPFSSGAIQKTIHTTPQVGLNQNERKNTSAQRIQR
jgi:predicted amidophosphoribosyltransferase